MENDKIVWKWWHHEIPIVKVSSVGEDFRKWLYGQTCPLVEEDEAPTDWAYMWDYDRWKAGLPIID